MGVTYVLYGVLKERAGDCFGQKIRPLLRIWNLRESQNTGLHLLLNVDVPNVKLLGVIRRATGMRDVESALVFRDEAEIYASVGDDVAILVFGGGFVINVQGCGPGQHGGVRILGQRGKLLECSCPRIGRDKFRHRK